MKKLTLSALASVALLAAPALAQDDQTSAETTAAASEDTAGGDMQPMEVTMNAPDGSDRGTVTVTPTPNGLLLEAELTGLEPGEHGFHIHETGQCGEDFSAAGGHYNPTDMEHGYMTEGGPHAGDMPNFTAGEDGSATFAVFNPNLTVSDGDAPVMDDDGSAIMVHGGADDYESQPAGDAGDRVACGVIGGAE
ncbi:superoxide dismutase [Fulvimarina pelagi HTCC2506]|uniref:Superoxide dismutase [Cu-Zn] n=1 Tax=Fulvimarina pelagi HTCC2506 TaxID=314231 RepID=Q0G5E7_9HYPH|nr:superoxide dismutase family protein [Fulvimarina pelagi]EAU43117.1 superoxide dismutase [Fulvimarina pelagi HTCC2506]